MPKITDAAKAVRRRQSIDAACRCFARQGFHRTSMRDIYQEAHLSAGAVYHYFASKAEIIAASFQFDAERSRPVFDAALRRPAPLPALLELIRFTYAGLEDAAAIDGGRVNVQAWAEALHDPALLDTIRRAFDGYRDTLRAMAADAQRTDAINPHLDPRSVAHALLSLYLGLELQKAWDPALDVLTYREAVAALIGGQFSTPAGSGGRSGNGSWSEREDRDDRLDHSHPA